MEILERFRSSPPTASTREIGGEPRGVWKTGLKDTGEPEGSPARPAIERFAGTKKAPANDLALSRLEYSDFHIRLPISQQRADCKPGIKALSIWR